MFDALVATQKAQHAAPKQPTQNYLMQAKKVESWGVPGTLDMSGGRAPSSQTLECRTPAALPVWQVHDYRWSGCK
jgi:hypothetical protein